MLIGDPFIFAMRYDIVDEWSKKSTCGLFEFYIDGKKYPKNTEITYFSPGWKPNFLEFLNSMKPLSEKDVSRIKKKGINVELNNLLIAEKKIMNIESNEISDEGITIYYFFDKKRDYILIDKYSRKRVNLKIYKKKYIYSILVQMLSNVEIGKPQSI